MALFQYPNSQHPCLDEIPDLRKLFLASHNRNSHQGVQILTVNSVTTIAENNHQHTHRSQRRIRLVQGIPGQDSKPVAVAGTVLAEVGDTVVELSSQVELPVDRMLEVLLGLLKLSE